MPCLDRQTYPHACLLWVDRQGARFGRHTVVIHSFTRGRLGDGTSHSVQVSLRCILQAQRCTPHNC